MTSILAPALKRLQDAPSVDAMVAAFAPVATSSISKNELKRELKALAALEAHLRANDLHEATAVALALLESLGEAALWAMRSAGIFRVSRYGFHEAAATLAVTVAAVGPKVPLSPQGMRYLASVAALHSLRAFLKTMADALNGELLVRREVALKSLLVLVDRAFVGNWRGGDTSLPGNDPLHYSNEDLAEGFSSIVGMFRQSVGLEPLHWARGDSEELLSPNSDYMLMLLMAWSWTSRHGN